MPAAARKIDLTDRSLRALKPTSAGKRITIWDLKKGLAVQVGAKGRPTFFAVYRLKGAAQPTWRKLGEYPTMGLAEAREAVGAAVEAMMAGKDPRAIAEAERKAEAEAARVAEVNTFAAVAERFNDWYKTTPGRRDQLRRRADDVAKTIRRELVPVWGGRPIREITEDDVLAVVEAIRVRGGTKAAPGSRRKSGGPYAARHAFAAARLVFAWASKKTQRLISVSPCAGIDPEADLSISPGMRKRVLSDDELPSVWAAAEATPYPYGPLVKLLLLTGARLREVAEASWREIDLDAATLTVPTDRMKMKIAHVIPLTPAAFAIVESLPRFAGGDYLFSTTGGRRPISGFSKFRAKFNKTLAAAAGRDLPAFTIHDLRRTARTGLGVLDEIAERVIGHLPQGVKATYDLHRYDKEKRAALEAWEAKLLVIVTPAPPAEGGNVVALRARA